MSHPQVTIATVAGDEPIYDRRWEVTRMLTFVIEASSHEIAPDQFRDLVDVGVRIMKDASRGTRIEFALAGLHASQPTLLWSPVTDGPEESAETEFKVVSRRIEDGMAMLERDAGVPEWMTAPTATALYRASALFDEGPIHGVSFSTNGAPIRVTRQTYRTLDRVLHEETEAVGSVTGLLVTATLRNGAHVTVEDDVHGKGVRCYVGREQLRAAGPMLGERVTATGRVSRDHLGRPTRIADARLERDEQRLRVTVSEMAGTFSGPTSTEWLREQRGG